MDASADLLTSASADLVVIESGHALDELLAPLDGGRAVCRASSLRAAFEAIALHQARAAILDLELDDGDGLDAVAAVLARFPSTAVVVVTDHDDDATVANALALGAQDVLSKHGLDGETLRRAVDKAVERKRAERSFHRAEERHRRVLDAAPVGVWRGTASGETIYANRQLARCFGRELVPADDPRAAPLVVLVGDAAWHQIEGLIGVAARHGHAWSPAAPRSGTSPAMAALSVTEVRSEPGGVEYLVFATPPAEIPPPASAAATVLSKAEASLIALSREGLIVVDPGLTVLAWNGGAEEIYGSSADVAVGRSMLDFIPSDQHEGVVAAMQRVVEGSPVTYSGVRRRPTGEERLVQIHLEPVTDDAGRVRVVAAVVRDVTEVRAALEARRESERLLERVVNAVPMRVTVVDPSGVVIFADGLGLRSSTVGAADLIGRSIFELYGDADSDALDALRRALGGETTSHLLQYRNRSWDVRHAPLVDDAGAVTAAVTVALDVTGRLNDESRFTKIVEHVADIITIHDADSRMTWLSPAGRRLFGAATAAEIPPLRKLVHPDDVDVVRSAFAEWQRGRSVTVSWRLIDLKGATRDVESVGVDLLDDEAVGGIVVTTRDVTERRIIHNELAHATRYDLLTDLPNRELFVARVQRGVDAARQDNRFVGLMVLDIDHFKLINDLFGREAGDEVLARSSRALRGALPPGAEATRLGADAFAAYLPAGATAADVYESAERVRAAVRADHLLAGRTVHVSCSLGLVLARADEAMPLQMVADAEMAMFAAKRRGRNRIETFDATAREQVLGPLNIESELRVAIERQEFRLFFQPQVDIRSGEISGFEALLRWNHPERGLLAPADFMAVAEESRLIEPIGAWVLRESCARAAEWRAMFPERPFSVAVNLSARQLADDTLPDLLIEVLGEHRIEPSSIILEITESMVMEDAEHSVRVLRRLKECGARIALDDFGTGYSSLAYLKRFPLDQIKIDRSFVAGLGRDPEDFVIVSAIVDLGRSLGVEVVAEGVENERHLAELDVIGCPSGQGYLWSPPVPAGSARSLLEQRVLGTTARPIAGTDVVASRSAAAKSIDVVSLLTHELRAPLTVIRGYAETMASYAGEVPPVVARASSAIARNVGTLDDIVRSLSDLDALEAGRLPLQRRTVDMAELTRVLLADHAPALAGHEIQVVVPQDRVEAHVDENRISQVLLNLLSNALKFSPEGEAIDVAVARRGADIEVSVRDRGPGVPPDQVGQIFRKFYKIEAGKKGTGLGLFIARSLARAHGGDLVCRQPAGDGAEFVLTLPGPKRPGSSAAAHVDTPAARAAPQASPAGQSTREADGRDHPTLTTAMNLLERAEVTEQIVGAGIALARGVGGGVIPARRADTTALPYDISFGHGNPLLPAAVPGSAERARLEATMPIFVERAVHAIVRVGGVEPSGRIDALTGFLGRRQSHRAVAGMRLGGWMALIRLQRKPDVPAGGPAGHLRELSRLVRAVFASDATLGRFGDDDIIA
ncbi:MAG TPA: EAL domain-containing protein, partial [Acidimicrobiales bacterium]|nr:EAL domain-containing protein [Acidimicrobiales bacterium]